MANTRAGSVIRVDTSAQFDGSFEIESIKYMGASSGTASIKEGSSSGNLVWEESGTSNKTDMGLEIQLRAGFYATVGSGAVLYIYLE